MGDSLSKVEKNLKALAKRYESVRYSKGLAILFLMLGVNAFSEENVEDHNQNQNTTDTDGNKDENSTEAVSKVQIKSTAAKLKERLEQIKKELLEIPAGLVEEGEDVYLAAQREFEEETGYRANKIEKICSYYGSAGINAGRYHIFYASELIKTEQHLDENEFLEIVKIPLNEINVYDFEDAKTIIALNYIKNKI